MVYVITDGNGQYIQEKQIGMFVLCRDRAKAREFDTKTKAENVIEHSVAGRIRHGLQIVQEGEVEPQKRTPKLFSGKTSSISEVEKLISDDSMDDKFTSWMERINALKTFVADRQNRANELNDSLRKIDCEIVDIQHYIEFSNLNVVDGFKAYKLLKMKLQNRRKIKNEMELLVKLEGCSISDKSFQSVYDWVGRIEHKVYKPRVLGELFGVDYEDTVFGSKSNTEDLQPSADLLDYVDG